MNVTGTEKRTLPETDAPARASGMLPEALGAFPEFAELKGHEQVADHGLIRVRVNMKNLDLPALYERELGTAAINALREQIRQLGPVRVAHINATAYGGGVAELLHRQVPLMNQLGTETGFHSDWLILNVDNPTFFEVTKKWHNALQGDPECLTPEEKALYHRTILTNYHQGRLSQYDVVIIHDPQPVGLIALYPERRNRWVWRCHLDTSRPNPEAWDFIAPFVYGFDTVVWTRNSFVQDRASCRNIHIIPPSIDPFSPKNIRLSDTQIMDVLRRYKIDPHRPVIVQVSRFDPWKRPLEVIRLYKELKREFPDLQLILAGSLATDDPEGLEFWEKSLRAAGEEPDIFILNNHHGVGNIEINAFQRCANVLIQYSSREGFGLTVSEGMWKSQPVVGSRIGGIQDQIVDGVSGFLVTTPEELKTAIRTLLCHPEQRQRMGEAAHARVAEHFLINREVSDYLQLIGELKRKSE